MSAPAFAMSCPPGRLSLLLLALFAAPAGCAHYEYDLVQPPEFAGHVGAGKPVEVTLEPLGYRLQTSESHLVMLVFNRGETPVRLLGDRSTVVDPRGQSHPFRGQTIAAGSYIKLVFPPLPPRVEPRGPVIGIGVGAVVTSGGYYRQRYLGGGPFGYDPVFDGPRYYSVYDPGDATYWEWDGEGDARLVLTFQQGDQKPFSHEFVFRRRKV
jgi:hypothetical protein